MNIIFEATITQFEAQKSEAIAELSILLSGEKEFNKNQIMNSVRKLADAERCLESLYKNFTEEAILEK